MKKILAITVVLAMAMSLCACSLFRTKNADDTPLTPDTNKNGTSQVPPNTAPAPDSSADTNPDTPAVMEEEDEIALPIDVAD